MTETSDAQISGIGDVFPFDPTDPVFRADPYPTYNRLREASAIHGTPLGLWVLTRHADVVGVLHHPETSNDQRNSKAFQQFLESGAESPFEDRTQSFLFLDPPDHTRLRGLVSHAFTPRRVRELGPRITEIVDGLLDDAIARGELEGVEEFAYPIPIWVICELLGVPPSDNVIFKEWSRELARSLDPEVMLPPEMLERRQRASDGLNGYLTGLIAERTEQPRDDLLSALIAVEQEGEKLTHEELLVTCGLLLIAGHETTVNLIANGLLAFAQNPEQYQALRADPSLAKPAVEEVLRYDPPVQLTGRIAMTEMPIGGQTVSAGEQAVCLIGAANRDPDAFDDPDRFDITRKPGPHIAFGAGIHFCLGAPLARLEGEIAFRRLAERVGGFELDGEPSYKDAFVLRGLDRLPLRLRT